MGLGAALQGGRSTWASALRAVVLHFYDQATESNSTAEPPSVRDDVVGHWSAFEAWRASRPSDVAVFELETDRKSTRLNSSHSSPSRMPSSA